MCVYIYVCVHSCVDSYVCVYVLRIKHNFQSSNTVIIITVIAHDNFNPM